MDTSRIVSAECIPGYSSLAHADRETLKVCSICTQRTFASSTQVNVGLGFDSNFESIGQTDWLRDIECPSFGCRSGSETSSCFLCHKKLVFGCSPHPCKINSGTKAQILTTAAKRQGTHPAACVLLSRPHFYIILGFRLQLLLDCKGVQKACVPDCKSLFEVELHIITRT